jgi:pimeloyl-ACP methyl ester carboxylesterase
MGVYIMRGIRKIFGRVVCVIIVGVIIYMTIIKGHTLPIFIRNSIAKYETVTLGDVNQTILIRGNNIENPVLLYLHGGPGNPETAFITKYQKEWEKHFIVVNWDQRGSGKSYNSKINADTLNIQGTYNDTIQLVEYLQKKFNTKKIYLVGHSWGTYLGMLAIKNNPQLFYAYIGVGQVADQQTNEFEIRKYALNNAEKEGNQKAISELKAIGEPPYNKTDFESKIGVNRKWSAYYGGALWGKNNTDQFTYEVIFGLHYNVFDLIKYLKGDNLFYKQTNQARWDLYSANLVKDIPSVEVPIYFCQGLHDNLTSYKLAKDYYEQIKAPKKEFKTFSNSAHFPNIEECDEFSAYLINTVLLQTYTK